MRNVRLDEMESYIIIHESATMEELCEKYDVSMNTIRRDVALLVRKGTIEKVYGGVRARKGEQMSTLASFETRSIKHKPFKASIGRKAASLVHDGDIIYLDSGTTTLHMIEAMSELRGVTVVTGNLHAIVAAMDAPNLSVIVLPGQLQRKTGSLTGLDALRMLKGYNINIAFMAATAMSLEHGVTNSSPLEYELKMTAMSRSDRRVLLLDSTKFGQTAMLTYAQPGDFDCVITDTMPSEDFVHALEAANTGIILA